jgi:uncharacterized damage-inducible protein DinB
MKTKTIRSFEVLESNRKQLLSEVASLPPEQLHQKPSPENWSTIQIINHLIMAEQGSLAYIQKKILTKENLQQAGWKSKWRLFVLKLALLMPIKYKAPKILPDPENDTPIVDCIQKWDGIRSDLRNLLNDLPEPMFTLEIFKHPVAGKMNMNQAIEFMNVHMTRHHQQIKSILRLK